MGGSFARFASMTALVVILGCSGAHQAWTPSKRFSFPGGSLQAPPWPEKAQGVAPFRGYVTWMPKDVTDQMMILAWQHEPIAPGPTLYRARALPYGAQQQWGMGHEAKKKTLPIVISDEGRMTVDGHRGWRYILRRKDGGPTVGVSCSWYCPKTGREFFLKCLQGAGRGMTAVKAAGRMLETLRCHEGDIDRDTLEARRYRLASGHDLAVKTLRPCADQYRDDSGKAAFTVYWKAPSFSRMSAADARGWGQAMAAVWKIRPMKWEPVRRRTNGHDAWEGVLEDRGGDREARFLKWTCDVTSRAYEVIQLVDEGSVAVASLHWKTALSLECHHDEK